MGAGCARVQRARRLVARDRAACVRCRRADAGEPGGLGVADTNNERVGKTLSLLANGLAPFVDRECGLKYGMDWENAVPGDGARSKTDIQFLLRTMTSTWREVFER